MTQVGPNGTLVVGAPGHHEKDSLAALAAAAEMDQVRSDVVRTLNPLQVWLIFIKWIIAISNINKNTSKNIKLLIKFYLDGDNSFLVILMR